MIALLFSPILCRSKLLHKLIQSNSNPFERMVVEVNVRDVFWPRKAVPKCLFPGFCPEDQPAHNLAWISSDSYQFQLPFTTMSHFFFFWRVPRGINFFGLIQSQLLCRRKNLELSSLWLASLPWQGKCLWHRFWCWEKGWECMFLWVNPSLRAQGLNNPAPVLLGLLLLAWTLYPQAGMRALRVSVFPVVP